MFEGPSWPTPRQSATPQLFFGWGRKTAKYVLATIGNCLLAASRGTEEPEAAVVATVVRR